MTYRSAIESRARQAAEAARVEVLLTELRMLEHELPLARTDRWAGEGEVEDMERAVAWLRRLLKVPVSPEERRERARRRRESRHPPQPEPEPIVEEPPNQHICWHETKPWFGWRCRGNHVDDLTIMFGSCRGDGDRWFWSTESLETTGVVERHGFEESAVRARVAAREAVIELANGRLAVARQSDDRASWTLRDLYPPERPTPRDPLADLRAAMVASHPDRGGNPSDFIEARQRFVAARRRWRKA